jgi:hypothetical protein
MIYIEKNSLNTFALTLTESATLSAPVWLFKFVWEMDETLAPIYWVGEDFSSYPNRYNLFYLTEGDDVTFKLGQYRYEIYESDEVIVVDENTTEEGLTLVEEGRMVVEGISNSIYD